MFGFTNTNYLIVSGLWRASCCEKKKACYKTGFEVPSAHPCQTFWGVSTGFLIPVLPLTDPKSFTLLTQSFIPQKIILKMKLYVAITTLIINLNSIHTVIFVSSDLNQYAVDSFYPSTAILYSTVWLSLLTLTICCCCNTTINI